MNKNTKKVTIRFYSIDTADTVLSDISAIYQASEQKVRIFNHREKKYFMKIEQLSDNQDETYFCSVVRERNTWQAKALRDGSISGIQLNQGIIGDTYYFFIHPAKKIIYGFTTGTTDSLKTVGGIILLQFKRSRTEKINLELVSVNNDVARVEELTDYRNLKIKVNGSELEEISPSAPEIIKALYTVFSIVNNTISIASVERDELLMIIEFFSGNDACTTLTVSGTNHSGENIILDLSRSAYLIYKSEIETRDNFIDESNALKILTKALEYLPS